MFLHLFIAIKLTRTEPIRQLLSILFISSLSSPIKEYVTSTLNIPVCLDSRTNQKICYIYLPQSALTVEPIRKSVWNVMQYILMNSFTDFKSCSKASSISSINEHLIAILKYSLNKLNIYFY